MDPTATLNEMREAMGSHEWEQARDRAAELLRWLDRGGNPPEGITRDDARTLAQTARAWARVERFIQTVTA